MGPRGPHAIFPPDHLFVNERRGEIIVVHALPPPVFTTSLLMNTGVSYKYIIHFVLCPYWKHYMYSGSKCIFHIKTNRYIKKTMIFAL